MVLEVLQAEWFSNVLQQAPVVIFLVTVIVAQRKDNRELVKYIQTQDRENLKVLNDLGQLLQHLIDSSADDTAIISQMVQKEAQDTRDHVRANIELLEARIVQRDRR